MEIIVGSVTGISLIALVGGIYCLSYSSRLIKEAEERQNNGKGYPL